MTESNIAATNRIRAQLAERWPALFNAKKPVPLAIGINEALLQAMPDITASLIRRVLSHWCSRPRYLSALMAGADRHGLEGVQGTVTEEQAADAAKRLQALQTLFREKEEARRKAEKARQAEAKKKADEAAAKQSAPPPAQPKPATAQPKPAGPVVMVKKRKFAQPATDS